MPLIGPAASLLFERGIYEGRFFERWMTELLEAKKVTKFGQLVDDAAEEEKNRYRLRVIASDVTHRRMLVLPNDADHLGIDPDELDIAHAVRMSMSIPVFFEPVVHRNEGTREEHLIVDGGMLSNFPVWLFDCEGHDPRWPTFGLKLVEPDPKKAIGHRLPGEDDGAKAGSLLDYFKSLASTMMEAHDRLYLETATFARTIPIPTLGVRTTEFDIKPERVRALYDSGHQAASDFLDQWDFGAYIEEFRRGKDHSGGPIWTPRRARPRAPVSSGRPTGSVSVPLAPRKPPERDQADEDDNDAEPQADEERQDYADDDDDTAGGYASGGTAVRCGHTLLLSGVLPDDNADLPASGAG